MSVIALDALTKRFGDIVAVDDLTVQLERGRVIGLLGPNGAGKTTTLRLLLGLVAPSSGSATIEGRPYRALDEPIRHIGAVLEATSFHPGRRARDHLRVLAATADLADHRVDEVLAQVGLAGAARRRVGGFSLGMRQRLGLAAALLGDPDVLVLDEPTNGLDPEGIHWLRDFLPRLRRVGTHRARLQPSAGRGGPNRRRSRRAGRRASRRPRPAVAAAGPSLGRACPHSRRRRAA